MTVFQMKILQYSVKKTWLQNYKKSGFAFESLISHSVILFLFLLYPFSGWEGAEDSNKPWTREKIYRAATLYCSISF